MLTATQPLITLTAQQDWVCVTHTGVFQYRQTEAGWEAYSSKRGVTAVYGDSLPHQAAALALLWQTVLQSRQPLLRVNTALLPDNSQALKQIMGRLQPLPQVTLECWHVHSYQSYNLDLLAALALVSTPQMLFGGAVNGPTYTYQRLVNADTGVVIAEWGDSRVMLQRAALRAAAQACAEASGEDIPEDVLPELNDEYF